MMTSKRRRSYAGSWSFLGQGDFCLIRHTGNSIKSTLTGLWLMMTSLSTIRPATVSPFAKMKKVENTGALGSVYLTAQLASST